MCRLYLGAQRLSQADFIHSGKREPNAHSVTLGRVSSCSICSLGQDRLVFCNSICLRFRVLHTKHTWATLLSVVGRHCSQSSIWHGCCVYLTCSVLHMLGREMTLGVQWCNSRSSVCCDSSCRGASSLTALQHVTACFAHARSRPTS